MGNITDIQIRQWIRVAQPIAKSDGDGLTFTLSKKGTASWVLRYRFGGIGKEITLGRYPDISLSAARKLATDHRANIQRGIDVAKKKRQIKTETAAAQSFKQLAHDYMDKVFPTLSNSTVKARRRQIEKIILPRIGSVAARDISAADIVSLIEDVGKRSIHIAEQILTAVSEICKHGMGKKVILANPCTGVSIKAICGKPEPKRIRLKLTSAELRAILPELPIIGKQNELAVKILLATCVRTGELAQAKWEHINYQQKEWLIPDCNSKTKKSFTVPLVPAVVGWFKELEMLACGSVYVLPARQKRRATKFGGEVYYERRALNSMIHKLCDKLGSKTRRFLPHDLRSTARSHLSELGVNMIVAERCLNHTLGGLVAVYDQHDYMNERRAALDLWTNFLLSSERDEDRNDITQKQTRVGI